MEMHPGQLTPTQRETLLFSVGLGGVTPWDLERQFDIGKRAAEARLERLSALGLLRKRKLRGWGPAFWVETRAGIATAETLRQLVA